MTIEKFKNKLWIITASKFQVATIKSKNNNIWNKIPWNYVKFGLHAYPDNTRFLYMLMTDNCVWLKKFHLTNLTEGKKTG